MFKWKIKRPKISWVIFKITEKLYRKQKKKNRSQSPIKLNIERWNWKNKSFKKEGKKKQMNLSNSLKPRLISQIQNPLNSKLEFNQETQFNIEWWNKKIYFKKISQ